MGVETRRFSVVCRRPRRTRHGRYCRLWTPHEGAPGGATPVPSGGVSAYAPARGHPAAGHQPGQLQSSVSPLLRCFQLEPASSWGQARLTPRYVRFVRHPFSA